MKNTNELESKGNEVFVSETSISQKEKDYLFSQMIALEAGYSVGQSKNNGDCFFDSLAKILNKLYSTESFSGKRLRMMCYEFYCKNDQNRTEINSLILEDSKQNFKDESSLSDYYHYIQYTNDEIERFHPGKTVIWGRPNIEGRIICKLLNLEAIQVIELMRVAEGSEFVVSYYEIGAQHYLQSDKLSIVKNLDKVPTIIASQQSLHFVPLMSKSYFRKKYDSSLSTDNNDSVKKNETKRKNETSHEVIFQELSELVEKNKTLQCAEITADTLVREIELLGRGIKEFKLDDNAVSLSLDGVISKLKVLEEQLTHEQLTTNDIKEVIFAVKTELINHNWSAGKTLLSKLLSEIRPFNVSKMLALLDEAEKSAERIKDQDIILLLGGTGAGKSTTIHFLSGSKMEKVTVEGIPHIKPRTVSNPLLEKVTTSPFAQSETQNIMAVPVNPEDIDSLHDSKVLLCDTPGFEDTNGAEVDVANGVSVVRAVSGCKSVRPLIFISKKSSGNRFEGLKKLAHTLVAYIPEMKEHIKTFSYCFTNYDNGEGRAIHSSIKHVLTSLSDEEKSDAGFVSLFKDLRKKTRQSVMIVDPIGGSPGDVLDEIMDTPAIKYPDEVFQCKISGKSRAAILEQVRFSQVYIENALKRNDFEKINYKMSQIKLLSEILNNKFVFQIYMDLVQTIKNHLEDIYQEAIDSMDRFLSDKNTLTIEDVKKYKESMSCLVKSEVLESVHLGKEIIRGDSLMLNLEQHVEKMLKKISDLEMDDGLLTIYLDKLETLKLENPSMQTAFKSAKKILRNKFDSVIKVAEEAIDQFDFDILAKNLSILKNAMSTLGKCFNRSLLDKVFNDVVNRAQVHLEKYVSSFDQALMKLQLDSQDIQNSNQCALLLDKVCCCSPLHSFVKLETLEVIRDAFYEKVISQFQNAKERIEKLFRNNEKKSMQEIRTQIKYIDSIRSIHGVEAKTLKDYYKIIEILCGYAHEVRRDAEQKIAMLSEQVAVAQSPGKHNNNRYRKLARSLHTLNNLKWLEELRPGIYADLSVDITDDLLFYAENLKSDLFDIEIDLQNADNIEKAYDILRQFDSLAHFVQFAPKLKECRDAAVKYFESSISSSLNIIEKSFNLDKENIDKLKSEKINLQEVKSECLQLRPINKLLDKYQYKSVDELSLDIDRNSVELTKFKEKSQISLLTMREKLDEYNLIETEYQQIIQSQAMSMLSFNFRKANAILSKHGFRDHNELLKKISTLSSDFGNSQVKIMNQIKEKESKIKYLQKIRLECDELLACDKITAEAYTLLRQNGFSDLKELDFAITNLSKRIEKFELQGFKYIFGQVDFEKAELALQYLKICKKACKHSITIKSKSDLLFDNFHKYFKQYASFIRQQMKGSFDIINDLCASDKIAQEVSLLVDRLDEIRLCKKKYTNIFSYLSDNEEILEKWSKILSNHVEDVNSLMRGHLHANDNILLKRKLHLIKMLRPLDKFINETENYKFVYRKYLEAYHKKASTTLENILTMIDQYNFSGVRTQLKCFSESESSENNLEINEAKETLRKTVSALLEEGRSEALMLGKNLELVKIRRLVKILKDIKAAKEEVGEYLSNSLLKEIEVTFEEIKHSINRCIHCYLVSIEAHIKVSNFYESAECIYNVSTVFRLLASDKFVTTANIDHLSRLEEEIQNKLTVIIERYRKMPLEDVPTNPPKLIYEKLKSVFSHDAKYFDAWQKISDGIVSRLSETLKNVQLGSMGKHQINICRAVLNSLPVNIKNGLESKLQNHIQDLESQESDKLSRLDEVLRSDNIDAIYTYMSEFHSRKLHKFKAYIRDGVMKKLDKLRDRFMQRLSQGDVVSGLKLAASIHEYSKLIEFIPPISTFVDVVTDNLSSVFDQASARLNNVQHMSTNQITSDIISRLTESFNVVICFEKFKFLNKKNSDAVPYYPKFYEKNVSTIIKNCVNFFASMNALFIKNLKEYNSIELDDVMTKSKVSERFYQKIKSSIADLSEDVCAKELKRNMASCKDYNALRKLLMVNLGDVYSAIVSFEPINSKTRNTQKQRSEYYQTINEKLFALKTMKALYAHVDNAIINVNTAYEQSLSDMTNKIRSLYETAFRVLEKNTISVSDYDKLNISYLNLSTIRDEFSVFQSYCSDCCDRLDEKLFDMVGVIEKKARDSFDNVEDFSSALIQIKIISDNVPLFKTIIDSKIDSLLDLFKKKWSGGKGLNRLGVVLEKDDSGVGQSVISEHKCFKGYAVSLFNTKTQRHGIKVVLEKLNGTNIDKSKLAKRYDEVDKLYKKLIKEYLDPKIDFEKLTNNIKLLGEKIDFEDGEIDWDGTVRSKIPTLIAHIFALWTLKNAHYYFDAHALEEDERKNYLLQPHAAQVISILRILGIGDKKEALSNNLVQIGTGEGKSVTLAVTAIILALFGIEANCVCYSQYLSQRDYQEFQSIFEMLDLSEYIKYGTFSKLCENAINRSGDVRTRVVDMMRNNVSNKKSKRSNKRPSVLLIDEVDVFFSKDFYGNVYSPVASISDDNVKSLIKYIWKNKNNDLSIEKVLESEEFQLCASQFEGWEYLIVEAVKDMLADLKTYQSHSYQVHKDKIAYKEQDGVSYNVVYGYKTLFAYFYEHEAGTISEKSLEDNICITVNCGHFSYADIPGKFNYIMGVTGTLKTLSNPEKKVIVEEYGIKRFTFMPSVFGENNLVFREDSDIKIENKDDYYMSLVDEINNNLNGKSKDVKRSVLVFFELKEKLLNFYNSTELSSIQEFVKIITEEVDMKEKNALIKRATTSGQVTLLTSCFGRGTDFVCRDQAVSTNGGVHVIQTFLSEELSEETQIKGRTARQGDYGSYSMVLLDQELEKYGIDKKQLKSIRKKSNYYAVLNQRRNAFFEREYENNHKHVAVVREEHQLAEKFIENIDSGNLEYVHNYLAARNKGSAVAKKSRTICLMDATGSMSSLIQNAKNTVGTMFERASTILHEQDLDVNQFEMQFVVYRNYESEEDKILQCSTWETKPGNLRAFMQTIQASGGYGIREAVEIGLWHVNQEAEQGEVSQVILIGDAAANTVQEVGEKRQYRGENEWIKTKFAEKTNYLIETDKLVERKIPVHAFFVRKSAESNFREIADKTGGRCEELDIDSDSGAETLTDLVTEEVLRNVGGADMGDRLVDEYRAQFSKAYK